MAKKKTNDEVKIDLKKHAYCLLGEYNGSNNPITVKCKNGHIEERKTLSSITHDGVKCKKCSGHKGKNTIEDVKKKAKENKLKLVTKEYKNNKTHMEYQCLVCKNIFSSRWDTLLKTFKNENNGCPDCGRKKRVSKNRWTLDKILSKIPKNFSLLTKKDVYNIRKDTIKIKCNKGHITQKRLQRFVSTRFECSKCNPPKKKKIEDYKKIAKIKNIKIIKQADSGIKKSVWECENGHRFEKSYVAVVDTKEPCSECVGRENWDLKKVKKFFKENNLILLDKKYTSRVKHKYKCVKCGTQNSITIHNLKIGHGCPGCGKIRSIEKKEKPKGEVLKFINSINYKLLTPLNKIKLSKKLELECDKKHKCQILYGNLLKGRRCVICSGQYVDLKICKAEGDRIGLKLLSNQKYENMDKKMKWKCQKGHEVLASYAEVKRRTYCPVCRPIDTLEVDDLHPKFDLAMEKNSLKNLHPNLELMKKHNINLEGKRPDRVILDPATDLFMFVEMKHKDKKTFTKKEVEKQLNTYQKIGEKHGARFMGVLLVSSTGEYPNSISINEAVKKLKKILKTNRLKYKKVS